MRSGVEGIHDRGSDAEKNGWDRPRRRGLRALGEPRAHHRYVETKATPAAPRV
jgi:hypothetical protein